MDIFNQAQDVLAAVEAKRGYTLPYHRMMAASDPELLKAYDAFYERLTLQDRHLTPYQKETVWAALLACVREVHGFIHMKRAEKAGLTHDDLTRSVSLAAVTEAWSVFGFSADHWSHWTQVNELHRSYLNLYQSAMGDMETGLGHLIGAVCHGACRRKVPMIIHLQKAFSAGLTVKQMAEALSYMIIPCGGNTLIEVVSYWEEAAKDMLVPSPS